MDNDNKYKYNKYKKKYINIKNKQLIEKYKFYLIHGTQSIESLDEILKEGYIRAGKYVDKKYANYSEGSDVIYANIRFDDLDNIKSHMPITFILSPKLLFDKEFTFQKGWGGDILMTIKQNDFRMEDKIKQIYEFVKNPDLPKKLLEKTEGSYIQHQLYTSQRISIKKYLLGVRCFCKREMVEQLQQKYPSIRFFTKNEFPSYEEVIKVHEP